jgi:hypothetical protein
VKRTGLKAENERLRLENDEWREDRVNLTLLINKLSQENEWLRRDRDSWHILAELANRRAEAVTTADFGPFEEDV